jgi:hypothetical protein
VVFAEPHQRHQHVSSAADILPFAGKAEDFWLAAERQIYYNYGETNERHHLGA